MTVDKSKYLSPSNLLWIWFFFQMSRPSSISVHIFQQLSRIQFCMVGMYVNSQLSLTYDLIANIQAFVMYQYGHWHEWRCFTILSWCQIVFVGNIRLPKFTYEYLLLLLTSQKYLNAGYWNLVEIKSVLPCTYCLTIVYYSLTLWKWHSF